MSIIERFKDKYAKSEPQVSLFDHSLGVAKIANELLKEVKCSKRTRTVIVLSSFLHDIGKLNEEFQTMLKGGKRSLLHESYSTNYLQCVLGGELKNIISFLRENSIEVPLDYDELDPEDKDDISAFIVSHHSRFYLSIVSEEPNLSGKYKVRHYWTLWYPDEIRKITLADLLFRYHPCGGFITLGDYTHSWSLEEKTKYHPLVERMIKGWECGEEQEIEESLEVFKETPKHLMRLIFEEVCEAMRHDR